MEIKKIDKRKTIDNTINKINKRLVSLYNTFGEDNPTYQNYVSRLSKNKLITYEKNGAFQVSRSSKNLNLNGFQIKTLLTLSKKGGTVKGLQSAARAELKSSGLKKPTIEEVNEYVDKMEFVKDNRDMITGISKQIKQGIAITDSLADLYNRSAGRSEELTYDELYELMRKAKGDYDKYIG